MQRVPGKINLRRNTERHIVLRLTKIKDKEQILKATREKQQITYKGISIRLTEDFSVETLQARRVWQDIFKVMKGKTYNQDYSTQQGSHSDLTEKSKVYRQAKVKRIQHNQTSFTTNAKGTSPGRKHRRRKRCTKTNSRNRIETPEIDKPTHILSPYF